MCNLLYMHVHGAAKKKGLGIRVGSHGKMEFFVKKASWFFLWETPIKLGHTEKHLGYKKNIGQGLPGFRNRNMMRCSHSRRP